MPLNRSVALLTSLVYFVQGALAISAVAFPLFLRGKGWTVSEIATFSFVVGLPWAFKVVYGALSDGIPIRGLRRKPYVIIASFLSIVSWLGLALLPQDRSFLYLLVVVGNLGFALTDVVTDALVVENSTEHNTQIYQSLAWGFRSFGAVLGGILGGWLAESIPYRWIFGLTASLPVMTLLGAFFIRETLQREERRGRLLWEPIKGSLAALFGGDLRQFSLLLIVTSFSASFSTPFFFFLKEKLSFNETFLGFLSSLTWLGAVLGCLVYGKFLTNTPVKKTLRWAVWLNFLNVLTTYWVIDRWTGATLSFLGGITGYISLLPFMAAAALLSRQKGIEGSLFALLMSINNLGQLVSTFIGGKLFDIMGLAPLILLSAMVALSGLFFVTRLRTVGG